MKSGISRFQLSARPELLALGSNFAPLWYTAQHAKDTTRSGSELAAGDAGSGGLDLAYATAWRRIDQRPHLGQVPRPDDEQEIGRKAVGQRRHDSHPRIDLHHAEHHPEGAHGKKDESGGESAVRPHP